MFQCRSSNLSNHLFVSCTRLLPSFPFIASYLFTSLALFIPLSPHHPFTFNPIPSSNRLQDSQRESSPHCLIQIHLHAVQSSRPYLLLTFILHSNKQASILGLDKWDSPRPLTPSRLLFNHSSDQNQTSNSISSLFLLPLNKPEN